MWLRFYFFSCNHRAGSCFGNVKTAHAIFRSGVTVCDREPTFKNNMLVYQDRYYLIGDEHKEFTANKSYSRAVVAAINDYFSREERLAADPFLEFREKEDAFLQKVLDTIREELQASGDGLAGLSALLQAVQPSSQAQKSMSNEDLDLAMDFINSL